MKGRKPAGAGTALERDVEDAEELLERADPSSDAIHFWRRNEHRNVWESIGAKPPADVQALGVVESVREWFGGGQYRGRIRSRGGQWGISRRFNIAGDAKPLVSTDVVPVPAAAAASGPPPWVTSFVLPILAAFGTMFAKKLLDGPQTDPLLLELIRINGKASRGEAIDPLEFQRLLLEAESKGEQRGRELGALSVRANRGGERGAGSAIERVAESAIKPLVGVLHRKLDQDERRLRVTRAVGGTNGNGAHTPPVTSATSTTEDPMNGNGTTNGAAASSVSTGDELRDLLVSVPRPARAFLLSAAENDEAPELYAEMVLSRLTDESAERMPILLARADFLDVLCETVPAYQTHREWFEQLVNAMRASVDAERGPADAEGLGGPPRVDVGDVGDVGDGLEAEQLDGQGTQRVESDA